MMVHIWDTCVTYPTMNSSRGFINETLRTDLETYKVRLDWKCIGFRQLINCRFGISVKRNINSCLCFKILAYFEDDSRIFEAEDYEKQFDKNIQNNHDIIYLSDKKPSRKSQRIVINHTKKDDSLYDEILMWLWDHQLVGFVILEVVGFFDCIAFFVCPWNFFFVLCFLVCLHFSVFFEEYYKMLIFWKHFKVWVFWKYAKLF